MITDSITAIRAQWHNWIEAIATGVLPDFPDLPPERRQQLQAHLKPDLARAAELQLIDISKGGWLKDVWPSLAVIRVPLSGSWAITVPKVSIQAFTLTKMQADILSRFNIISALLSSYKAQYTPRQKVSSDTATTV